GPFRSAHAVPQLRGGLPLALCLVQSLLRLGLGRSPYGPRVPEGGPQSVRHLLAGPAALSTARHVDRSAVKIADHARRDSEIAPRVRAAFQEVLPKARVSCLLGRVEQDRNVPAPRAVARPATRPFEMPRERVLLGAVAVDLELSGEVPREARVTVRSRFVRTVLNEPAVDVRRDAGPGAGAAARIRLAIVVVTARIAAAGRVGFVDGVNQDERVRERLSRPL